MELSNLAGILSGVREQSPPAPLEFPSCRVSGGEGTAAGDRGETHGSRALSEDF